MSKAPAMRPLFWVGASREDVRTFPTEVRDAIGFGLYQAQLGGKHVGARPLKGFGGAGVVELIEDHDGNTYRAIYTVRFRGAVYALHAFQKKSKQGIATPKRELDLVKQRLRGAQEHHAEWSRKERRE